MSEESQETKQRKRAAADLNAIDELRRTPAYTEYFERRVNEEVEKRRQKLLEDRSLTAEELYQERLLYFAVLDTSRMMEKDEVGCRNILGPVAD